MMDIVKAIYDMMGKYTYPVLKEDTPRQHVDAFFQVPYIPMHRLTLIGREMLLRGGTVCSRREQGVCFQIS